MQDLIKYYAYHATDIKNIDSIIKDNFTYHDNKEHWLGNGNYFFIDPELARYWGKNPSKKYGKIDNPAYLFVIIEVNSENVFDIRYLKNYNKAKYNFCNFYKSMIKKSLENNYRLKNFNYLKLRRAFFDWFVDKYNIECIVCYLSDREYLSIKTSKDSEFNSLHLPYLEVQICAKNNNIIKHIEQIYL